MCACIFNTVLMCGCGVCVRACLRVCARTEHHADDRSCVRVCARARAFACACACARVCKVTENRRAKRERGVRPLRPVRARDSLSLIRLLGATPSDCTLPVAAFDRLTQPYSSVGSDAKQLYITSCGVRPLRPVCACVRARVCACVRACVRVYCI